MPAPGGHRDYRLPAFRLPVGRCRVPEGRTGRAPGAGLLEAAGLADAFSGSGAVAVVTSSPEDSGCSPASSVSGSAVPTVAREPGLRRLTTRRVWVRTSSVRSRSVTRSGVAKKIDE